MPMTDDQLLSAYRRELECAHEAGRAPSGAWADRSRDAANLRAEIEHRGLPIPAYKPKE